MTNRRQFLALGIAASAWPVIGPAAAASGAGTARGAAVETVVCDRRIAASAAFAVHLARRGARTAAIDGDVTALWYHDLALRWREAPAAIAGLTGADALFCLEQLARDHRMRVVFRAERVAAGGRVERHVSGPEHLVAHAARLDCGHADDAAALAALAAECPADALAGAPQRAARLRARHDTKAAPGVAWVIAPVLRT